MRGKLGLLGLIAVSVGCKSPYAESASKYDDHVAAMKKLGFPQTKDEVRKDPGLKESENLQTYLEKLDADKLSKTDKRLTQSLALQDFASVKSIINENRDLYQLAEKAATAKGWYVDRDWDLGPSLMFPEYIVLKSMWKLLVARARLTAADGNLAGAVADLKRARNLAELADDEPVLVAMLMSIAGHTAVNKAYTQIAERIRAPAQLDRLSASMGAEPKPRSIRPGLRSEYYMALALARNFEAMGGFKAFETFSGMDPSGDPTKVLVPEKVIRAGAPASVESKAYIVAYGSVIEKVAKGEAYRADDSAAMGLELDRDAKSWQASKKREATFVTVLLPVFSQAGFATLQPPNTYRMAKVYIAALAAKARTGRLPDRAPLSLPDLMGSGPLKYKRTERGFLVYSVFTDGKDDGGVKSKDSSVPGGGHDYVWEYIP